MPCVTNRTGAEILERSCSLYANDARRGAQAAHGAVLMNAVKQSGYVATSGLARGRFVDTCIPALPAAAGTDTAHDNLNSKVVIGGWYSLKWCGIASRRVRHACSTRVVDGPVSSLKQTHHSTCGPQPWPGHMDSRDACRHSFKPRVLSTRSPFFAAAR